MAVTEELGVRIAQVRERILRACDRVDRDPISIELVAVTKAQPETKIRAAHRAGLRVFAENYAQALAERSRQLEDLPDVRWRFVGHLQRNKIRLVLGVGASVDTVDSVRLSEALDARVSDRSNPLDVLVQVNVGGERQKSGCAPERVSELVAVVRTLPSLKLRGLMTVAPHHRDPRHARPCFARLRALAETHGLQELSMGMSHDFEIAIEEGATMIRVGTAIFGPRPR